MKRKLLVIAEGIVLSTGPVPVGTELVGDFGDSLRCWLYFGQVKDLVAYVEPVIEPEPVVVVGPVLPAEPNPEPEPEPSAPKKGK